MKNKTKNYMWTGVWTVQYETLLECEQSSIKHCWSVKSPVSNTHENKGIVIPLWN